MVDARVIALYSDDMYVSSDPVTKKLSGILVELWNQTATDLNLTYEITLKHEWWKTFGELNESHADVLLQVADLSQTSRYDR